LIKDVALTSFSLHDTYHSFASRAQ